MDQTGLMLKLARELYGEKLSTDQEALSKQRAETNVHRAELLQIVKEAKASKDIDLILDVERAFLVNDLELYGNSAGMRSSLTEGITGIDQTKKLLVMLRDPDPSRYAAIDDMLKLSTNRTRNGMPKDEARKFFSAQVTRLKNMDKSRLSTEEKMLVAERQPMLRAGEKVYKRIQHQVMTTLGRAAAKEQPSRGREME